MTCFPVAPVCSRRHRSSQVGADIKSWRTVFVLYSFRDDWTGLAAPGVSKGSRLPAINIQESALNVTGLWRSQKRHRPGDFNGFSETRNTRRQRHRARGLRLFNPLFGCQRPQPKLQSFCNNRSRVDRIDRTRNIGTNVASYDLASPLRQIQIKELIPEFPLRIV
jgi:hypothetical protein